MISKIVRVTKKRVLFIILIVIFFVIQALSTTLHRKFDISLAEKFDNSPEYSKTKKILLWNNFFEDADYKFGFGKSPFARHRCPVNDCFVSNKIGSIRIEEFDAIIFHGGEFNPRTKIFFPSKRAGFQRYVYLSMEPPQSRPASAILDGFFNWTMTHRLNSDIPIPYFYFKAIATSEIVAPKNDPKWIDPDYNSQKLQKYSYIYKKKSKNVAWFVSNCKSNSKRESKVRDLNKFLPVDVYGGCGSLNCPRSNEQTCFQILKDDYFFYLSFENSICDDYVTEKITNAMLNDVIPVTFNGADLSKFLPPGSYIDANNLSAEKLANLIKELVQSPEKYAKYFWWREYYTLEKAIPDFCKLCEMLHNKKLEIKTYATMQGWWHGQGAHPICEDMN